jgi:hypothetical protein
MTNNATELFTNCQSISITLHKSLASRLEVNINCSRMSCEVCLLSTTQGLVQIQQSVLNRKLYSDLSDHCTQFISHVRQNRYLLHATKILCSTLETYSKQHRIQLCVYSKQHCGMLQVTLCSFSSYPPLLLCDLLHKSLCSLMLLQMTLMIELLITHHS